MKLATLASPRPDGRLVVVSRDGRRAAAAEEIVPDLRTALERWAQVAAPLRERAAALEAGTLPEAFDFDASQALAPLPRTWQWLDASAFPSHHALMSQVFGTPKLAYDTVPLMYQGMSHQFLAGHQEVPMVDEADGIDFEGEFGVIVDDVPTGTNAEDAADHIKLIVLINDWSLRRLAPIEMRTGFGWIQAKPACSMAPLAVTPDELGDAWRDGRVSLPLLVSWNGASFGRADGAAMAFGFPELVAHAARTRDLCAGTIIGSGTVSNENFRLVGSSCIAERRGIESVDSGEPTTPFMSFGDTVTMAAELAGESVFGEIDQRLVRAAP